MPNWCSCTTAIQGHENSGTEAIDKIEAAIRPFENSSELEWDFNSLVPLMEDCKPIGWNYNIAVATWGTKWVPVVRSHDRSGNSITISFDSAWSPPLKFLKALCEALPITAAISYEEPGMQFAGEAEYKHAGEGQVEIIKEEEWETQSLDIDK
jgi:hypothetical protein